MRRRIAMLSLSSTCLSRLMAKRFSHARLSASVRFLTPVFVLSECHIQAPMKRIRNSPMTTTNAGGESLYVQLQGTDPGLFTKIDCILEARRVIRCV
jgi:hypothetical protein